MKTGKGSEMGKCNNHLEETETRVIVDAEMAAARARQNIALLGRFHLSRHSAPCSFPLPQMLDAPFVNYLPVATRYSVVKRAAPKPNS